jgi:hypothetical protein
VLWAVACLDGGRRCRVLCRGGRCDADSLKRVLCAAGYDPTGVSTSSSSAEIRLPGSPDLPNNSSSVGMKLEIAPTSWPRKLCKFFMESCNIVSRSCDSWSKPRSSWGRGSGSRLQKLRSGMA